MKSRKFEIIYIRLCSHQSSVSGGPILNNGTQFPAEKLNVWRLKKRNISYTTFIQTFRNLF